MSSGLLVAAGLVGAGFAYGFIPRRPVAPGVKTRAAGTVKWIGIGLLVVVALLMSVLLLAKLFDSAVLGWIFGLSLMAGAALFAGAVLFVIGLLVGAICRRTPLTVPVAPEPELTSKPGPIVSPMVDVGIDRDTVHASDGGEPFPMVVSIEANCTLADLLARIDTGNSLPGISGGQATWTVESSGGVATLAVLAQQWTESRWLASPDEPVGTHFAGVAATLRLKYWNQIDPDEVCSRLRP